VNVQTPDGRTWKVRRRWFPRRPRLGRAELADSTPEWLDVGGLGDDLTGIVLAIVIGVVGFLLVLVLFNVVAIAIELILLVLVLFGGMFARVVLRRPWVVQASTDGPPADRRAWKVVGWRRGNRVIADVASQLAAGRQTPDPAEASGVQIDAARQYR
jgi:hypothetical protein